LLETEKYMLKQKSFNHCKNDKITCLSKCY